MMTLTDKIGYSGYNGDTRGYFFLLSPENDIISMRTCRDEIRMDWDNYLKQGTKINKIGFKLETLNIKSVQQFWKRRFESLGEQSVFEIHETNMAHTIAIALPNFWTENDTTRSIFTLLLRTSVVYYDGNFENAIEKYALARQVKPAINWFLAGNTHPTYTTWTNKHANGYHGFVGEFSDINSETALAQKLVKP